MLHPLSLLVPRLFQTFRATKRLACYSAKSHCLFCFRACFRLSQLLATRKRAEEINGRGLRERRVSMVSASLPKSMVTCQKALQCCKMRLSAKRLLNSVGVRRGLCRQQCTYSVETGCLSSANPTTDPAPGPISLVPLSVPPSQLETALHSFQKLIIIGFLGESVIDMLLARKCLQYPILWLVFVSLLLLEPIQSEEIGSAKIVCGNCQSSDISIRFDSTAPCQDLKPCKTHMCHSFRPAYLYTCKNPQCADKWHKYVFHGDCPRPQDKCNCGIRP